MEKPPAGPDTGLALEGAFGKATKISVPLLPHGHVPQDAESLRLWRTELFQETEKPVEHALPKDRKSPLSCCDSSMRSRTCTAVVHDQKAMSGFNWNDTDVSTYFMNSTGAPFSPRSVSVVMGVVMFTVPGQPLGT